MILYLSLLFSAAISTIGASESRPNWAITSASRVSEKGDLAFVVECLNSEGESILTSNYAYAVIITQTDRIRCHFIVESEGAMEVAWRPQGTKLNLTALCAPADPNASYKWIDICLDEADYKTAEHRLPPRVHAYDLTWSPQGDAMAMTLFDLSNIKYTQAVITNEFSDAKKIKMPTLGTPKGIIWRDKNNYYTKVVDIIYLVNVQQDNPEPKIATTDARDVIFYSVLGSKLVYLDTNVVYIHEKVVHTFQGEPRRLFSDSTVVALQDGNRIIVFDLKNENNLYYFIQSNDLLLGVSEQRQSIFLRRGLKSIDEVFYSKNWRCETVFDVNSISFVP